jgi:hypothetical protein
MSNEITAPDGSKWQWKDGEWVKAEKKRGPLGGELDYVKNLEIGDACFLKAVVDEKEHGWVHLKIDDSDSTMPVRPQTIVETNIPPRLAGERMTDAELAAEAGTGNLDGRWVAAQVGGANAGVILLPEGFGE